MPILERTVVKCDFCDAEVVKSGQVRSAAEADAMVGGTQLPHGVRVPRDWVYVHGKFACPRHRVTVDMVDFDQPSLTDTHLRLLASPGLTIQPS